MSTHLPPLQLCLMIWAELKSVKGAMFRETESRVTMETRLQVQHCREYWICSWESYTMSQTDIRNSNQYQQAAAARMRPSHSSAAEFDFPLGAGVRVADVVTSPFVRLACRVKTANSANPTIAGKFKKKHNNSGRPNSSQPIRALGWTHSFKLSPSPCGCTCGCVCISPTAAPGLHLIRPLFLSCPNRQALWVMNISQAAFQQQQVQCQSLSAANDSDRLFYYTQKVCEQKVSGEV